MLKIKIHYEFKIVIVEEKKDHHKYVIPVTAQTQQSTTTIRILGSDKQLE
jgi:hypothetical protein